MGTRRYGSMSQRAIDTLEPFAEIPQGFNTAPLQIVHWPKDTEAPTLALVQSGDVVNITLFQARELQKILARWMDGHNERGDPSLEWARRAGC